MDTAELIEYARSIAAKKDLFELLNVDATSTKEEIHSAWRRKALTHHPDKAGAAYDAEKYEELARARDVLMDPAAREAYDNGRSAVLQAKRRLEEMTGEQRRFAVELEEAERRARLAKSGVVEKSAEQQRRDDEALREMERRHGEWLAKNEERKRLTREALERENAKEAEKVAREDARIAEIEQLLKEKRARKAAKTAARARRNEGKQNAGDAAAAGQETVTTEEAIAAAAAAAATSRPPPRALEKPDDVVMEDDGLSPEEIGHEAMALVNQVMANALTAKAFAATLVEAVKTAAKPADSIEAVQLCLKTAQKVHVTSEKSHNTLAEYRRWLQAENDRPAAPRPPADTRDGNWRLLKAWGTAVQTRKDAVKLEAASKDALDRIRPYKVDPTTEAALRTACAKLQELAQEAEMAVIRFVEVEEWEGKMKGPSGRTTTM